MCCCCFTEAADGCSTKLCNRVMHFYSDGETGIGDVTALFMAAAKNHVDVAKVLLQHGADVNAKTE